MTERRWASSIGQETLIRTGLRITTVLLISLTLILADLPGVQPTRKAQAATADATTWVSKSTSGPHSDPRLSEDGRFVAFNGWADDLVPGDSNDQPDIFVYDRTSDSIERVSIASDGSQANNGVTPKIPPSISSDGRYVVFESDSSNLIAGDTNGAPDVFLHDRTTGMTTRVSVDSTGSQGNSWSQRPAISGDGRHVAFQSLATNLVAGDSNGKADVFVHDTTTGATVRASVSTGGAEGDGGSGGPAVSRNGTLIAFESLATNLVSGDTNGAKDIFVRNVSSGTTDRVSVASDGSQANGGSNYSSIAAEGGHVSFDSDASNLVAGDTNSSTDGFVHDLTTGETTRDTLDSSGGQLGGYGGCGQLSPDGRYFSFYTVDNGVTSGDHNTYSWGDPIPDVFVRDRQRGRVLKVSLGNLSQQGDDESFCPSVSADGAVVAYPSFATTLTAGSQPGFPISHVFVTVVGLIKPAPIPDQQTYGPSGAGTTGSSGGGGRDHGVNPTVSRTDPVNTATGAFMRVEEDLHLPGVGLPFEFTRYYTSADDETGSLGLAWTHSYAPSLEFDIDGNITLRGETGQRLGYSKQPDNSFIPPPGGRSQIAPVTGGYDLTRADQAVYHFDSNGVLISIEDRNGNELGMSYNTDGNLDEITDSVGRTIEFTHNTDDLLTKVQTPDGRAVNYAYDTSHRLSTVTDVRGGTIEYTYTSAGLLKKVTDQNGHAVVTNTYDSAGRVTHQVDALGHSSTFSWDDSTETSVMTDAEGHAWTDVYAGNILTSSTDPLGNVVEYSYDPDLNVTRLTDPLGNVTESVSDNAGNLLERVAPDPLAFSETFTYDASNNPTSATDGRNKTTSFSYDASGNLTAMTQPGSIATGYSYTSNGSLASITDPRGKTTTFGYDGVGNLEEIQTPLGHRTTMDHDTAGRIVERVEARGNEPGAVATDFTWTLTYDAAGNLLTETDPLGNQTAYSYDGVGNLASVTDAKGKFTTYVYDPGNHLVKVSAADSTSTAYAYDDAGNLTSRTDARGRTTSYGYDDANRLESMTTPEGNTWTYAYDASGNRIQIVDANGNATPISGDGTTTFTYDVLNRLVGIDYSDAATPDVTYGYDAASNQTSMTDGLAGTETRSYDDLSRLTKIRRGAAEITYLHDDSGNVTRRSYPDGTQLDYTYNNDGSPSSASSAGGTTTYGYDPAGRLATTSLPNGVAETRTYDRAGRLTRIRSVDGSSVISDHAYTLDEVGNPTEVVSAADTTLYKYDPLYRIKKVCFGTSCGPETEFISYTYDGVGNRRGEKRALSALSYSYDDDDRLTSVVSEATAEAEETLIASVTVDSTDPIGEFTPPLVVGVNYRLEVTGTYQYGSTSTQFEADAECSIALGDPVWDAQRFSTSGHDPLDLYASDGLTNGTLDSRVAWQPLEPDSSGDCASDNSHTYEHRFTAALPNPVTLKIQDTTLGDNSGSLQVSLYQVDSGGIPGGTYARVVVDAASSTGATTPPLIAGQDYILRARYSYTYGTASPQMVADTECSKAPGDPEFIPDRFGSSTPAIGDDPLDVYVDDGVVNGVADGAVTWSPAEATNASGECAADPLHTYEHRLTAQVNGPLTLKVQDATPGDNDGEVIVDVVQVVSEMSYTHDANGSLVAADSVGYAYDQAGRLAQITDGPTTTSYTYDGDSKRATTTIASPPVPNATTGYTWDPNAAWPQLAMETDAAGATARSYTFGAAVHEMRSGGGDFYYHHDALGSVVALTDDAADPQWSYGYEPFGALRTETAAAPGAPANDLLFTGQLLDRVSGLYHLRARQYDPAMGRFLTTDPVPAQITDPYVASYVYVNNRPTVLVDPRGEFGFFGGVIGAVVGAVAGGITAVVTSGDLSLRRFASGAAGGAVAGFAAGATAGASLLTSVAFTAIGGAAGAGASAVVCGHAPTRTELVRGAVFNAVGSGAATAISALAGSAGGVVESTARGASVGFATNAAARGTVGAFALEALGSLAPNCGTPARSTGK